MSYHLLNFVNVSSLAQGMAVSSRPDIFQDARRNAIITLPTLHTPIGVRQELTVDERLLAELQEATQTI